MNILLIGNSYTYYNDMPNILEKLFKDNGNEINVYSVAKGGQKLYLYLKDNDEYTHMIDDFVREHEFEICILQEHSCLPIMEYDVFEKGVLEIVEKIKKSVRNFVLYETWARKEGDKLFGELGINNIEMTDKLHKSYHSVADVINARISPVGDNFLKISSEYKEIELYNEDLSHPSYQGSCLVALTHYYTILDEFPSDTESLLLSSEEIEAFKRIILEI